MKRQLFLALFATATLTLAAQNVQTGQGKLVIVQDETVEKLLHSKHADRAAMRNAESENAEATERSDAQTSQQNANRRNGPRRHYNSAGYRLQIFTGGNSRADKQGALQAQQKCRAACPELATYVHFYSPHWVCRAGDFQKREDAQRYVSKLRARGLEARIIRSNIIVSK
ncbi:MAG: SPOR domain-containing protein [Alloprevotella sp.]|nr:SPOR domain-containing protein [Alloprevotella sp.]MBR1652975.1 SPOR domain-containing protein [Alloprevotella sp.]MBR1653157.1 SPOR domain-containing protein [Alloprevotella sp.]